MPTYTFISQGTALQQLANRLYDPTMTFWTQAELALYLNESLMQWNALTSKWRGDFTFSSASNVIWYDLSSIAQMPNTLRPYTVTDAALYTQMQYHLLEPPSGINPWPVTGSLQFSASDFLNAVQRRRNELLSLTGCTVTQSLIPAVAGRIQLAEDIIDVRRMAYIPSSLFPSQSASVMWPEDAWAEQSFNRSYVQAPAGTPFSYLMSSQPPISFDTDRPPAYAGSYELLTVNAGPPLSVSSPSTLLIPDDWTPTLKWGALADLLSRESDAKDIPRATYCESRYRLGVAAMLSAPALLALRVNNVPVLLDSVRAADTYNTGWEGATSGTLSAAYVAGLNLIAFNSLIAGVPSEFGSGYGTGAYGIGAYGLGAIISGLSNGYGAGAYGAGAYGVATVSYPLLATVVRNAPLPVLLTDPVQVSREDLDSILDYAQHIATFKQGGQEFAQTMPLLQRFLKQAAVYNAKLLEMGEFTAMLLGVSQMESGMNPVMQPSGESAAGAVSAGGGSFANG